MPPVVALSGAAAASAANGPVGACNDTTDSVGAVPRGTGSSDAPISSGGTSACAARRPRQRRPHRPWADQGRSRSGARRRRRIDGLADPERGRVTTSSEGELLGQPAVHNGVQATGLAKPHLPQPIDVGVVEPEDRVTTRHLEGAHPSRGSTDVHVHGAVREVLERSARDRCGYVLRTDHHRSPIPTTPRTQSAPAPHPLPHSPPAVANRRSSPGPAAARGVGWPTRRASSPAGTPAEADDSPAGQHRCSSNRAAPNRAGPPSATTASRTIDSKWWRYIRCHGRNHQVPCSHSFHSAPAGHCPAGVKVPCALARCSHDVGSAGSRVCRTAIARRVPEQRRVPGVLRAERPHVGTFAQRHAAGGGGRDRLQLPHLPRLTLDIPERLPRPIGKTDRVPQMPRRIHRRTHGHHHRRP